MSLKSHLVGNGWPNPHDLAAQKEISERLLALSELTGQPMVEYLDKLRAKIAVGFSWTMALELIEQEAKTDQLTIYDYLEGRVKIGE